MGFFPLKKHKLASTKHAIFCIYLEINKKTGCGRRRIHGRPDAIGSKLRMQATEPRPQVMRFQVEGKQRGYGRRPHLDRIPGVSESKYYYHANSYLLKLSF